MQIACDNCSKSFNLDETLIPNEGRYLQCGSCNHKWFFKIEKNKKKIIHKEIKKDYIEIKTPEIKKKKFNESKSKKLDKETSKDKKKVNLFNLVLLFVISVTAVILILDTFKYNLRTIFPSVDYILENLYESIKDINLFIKDLLK
tara:strand:- start:478 stop:912 length:435 start_codon:yes stop_codon:yes gene_type:complete